MSPRALKSSRIIFLLATVALAALATWMVAARVNRPHVIGFLGCLSDSSSVGPACRDGALSAIEEYNATLGSRGDAVSLIIRDTRSGDIHSHIREMADAGARTVLGPTCAECLGRAIEAAEAHGVVLLTPVVSSELAPGEERPLLSTYPKVARRVEFMVRHLQGRKYRRAAVLTAPWTLHAGTLFQDAFGRTTGTTCSRHDLPAAGGPDLRQTAFEIAEEAPEAVLLLAQPVDNALVAQHLRRRGYGGIIITEEFLATRDYIAFGGEAVEGTLVFSTFQAEQSSDRFRSFRDRFARRFGYSPDAAAVHSYDATRMLLSTVGSAGSGAEARSTLLRQSYSGLQDRITLSADGDVRREIYPMLLRNGALVPAK